MVACIGNTFRGDDGAGHRVADLLSGEAGAEVIRLQTLTELLDHLTGDIDLLVIVDAMEKFSGGGTIHRLDSTDKLSKTAAWRSTHTMTLPEIIGLADSLRMLPARILVYGIEGERFEQGSGLSESVEKACISVASEIKKMLRSSEE
jgi:hydrogenase maturation protease